MDFTKEQLLDAVQKLVDHPTDLLEFYYGTEQRQTVVAKIRFQNTAGGMQFGLRMVSERGEGSGIYFFEVEAEMLVNTAIKLLKGRTASLPTGYAPVNHLFEIRFRFVPDHHTPGLHTFDPDTIPGMEGVEEITLTLPEQTK